MRLKKGAQALGAALMVASGIGLASIASTAAHADPAYSYGQGNTPNVLAGMGSDTIQDVAAAFTGQDNSKAYAPLLAVGNEQMASFDAVVPGTGVNGTAPVLGCVVTKPGAPFLDRANGSKNGAQVLSDALTGANWPNSSDLNPNAPTGGIQGSTGQPAACNQNHGAAGGVPVPGSAIDFARSSSGPGVTTGGDVLRFVPFARDGVSIVCYDTTAHAGSATDACHVTTAELQAGFSNTSTGTFTDSAGDTVGVCMMQNGSGTAGFWATALGQLAATQQSAASASGCGHTLEEHNANAFLTQVQGLITGGSTIKAWVEPFSAAQWVAQGNGAAFDRSANLRNLPVVAGSQHGTLGDIDGIVAVTGTAPNLVPSPTYYATSYGRDMYFVVGTTALTGTSKSGGDVNIQNMFGSTLAQSPLNTEPGNVAVICQAAAQATVQLFGFGTTLGAGHTCGIGLASSYF